MEGFPSAISDCPTQLHMALKTPTSRYVFTAPTSMVVQTHGRASDIHIPKQRYHSGDFLFYQNMNQPKPGANWVLPLQLCGPSC